MASVKAGTRLSTIASTAFGATTANFAILTTILQASSRVNKTRRRSAPRSTPVHSSRLPIKQAWGSSIVQGGWKRRSSMADRFHLIGKRLSPAMGDDVPNLMDAN